MAAVEDVAERFGTNLKRCRRRADLSQEEMGLRASLHRTEISQLERGLRVARIDTLIKLAGAVEADATDLLDGSPGFRAICGSAASSRRSRAG
jgi:transcriptional regulator with XRE-family HTH domain